MTNDFKQELKASIIPAITNMVHKEEAHIASLKKRKEYFMRPRWFHKIFSGFIARNTSSFEKMVDEFIFRSETHLLYYKTRLKEYIDYSEMD